MASPDSRVVHPIRRAEVHPTSAEPVWRPKRVSKAGNPFHSGDDARIRPASLQRNAAGASHLRVGRHRFGRVHRASMIASPMYLSIVPPSHSE